MHVRKLGGKMTRNHLVAELDRAVAKEDYERAAILRDQIESYVEMTDASRAVTTIGDHIAEQGKFQMQLIGAWPVVQEAMVRAILEKHGDVVMAYQADKLVTRFTDYRNFTMDIMFRGEKLLHLYREGDQIIIQHQLP
jgi:hypothetical protein